MWCVEILCNLVYSRLVHPMRSGDSLCALYALYGLCTAFTFLPFARGMHYRFDAIGLSDLHEDYFSLLYDQTELEDPLPDELDEPLAPSGVHNMRRGMDVPKPDDLPPATTAGIVLAAVIGTCVVAMAMCMWMCPDWRADLARVVPLSLV